MSRPEFKSARHVAFTAAAVSYKKNLHRKINNSQLREELKGVEKNNTYDK